MSNHLFQANVRSRWDVNNDRPGTKQYVVAEAPTRSRAAGKAMRKVYALNSTASDFDLHRVELTYLGTVEVAR